MEIFRFDRREKNIGSFGSKGFLATRIAAGDGNIHLTCLTLEPEDPGGPCPMCGQPGTELATWGQAY